MVGGEDRKSAVLETAPDGVVVFGAVAGWRGTDAFRAFEARLVEVVAGEEEVLRAGFGVDGEALCLRGADVFCGCGGGDMDDQDGGGDEGGEGDGAVCGFGFQELGAGCGVVFWRVEALFFELVGHPGEDVAVFGVDHCCDAVFAGGEEHVEDLVVAELEGFVGHVDF